MKRPNVAPITPCSKPPLSLDFIGITYHSQNERKKVPFGVSGWWIFEGDYRHGGLRRDGGLRRGWWTSHKRWTLQARL